MSEKTEKPTEKRIRDARQKGQVIKSQDVTTGVQLTLLLLFFNFQAEPLMLRLEELINTTLEVINQPLLYAIDRILAVFWDVCLHFMGSMALLLIVVTVLTQVAQVGPLFAPEAIKPSGKKINPIENAKQLVSMKSLFELCKSIFKVTLLSLILFYLIRQYSPSLQFLPLHNLEGGIRVTAQLVFWMWGVLIAFYVLFGIADYAVQRRSVMKQLMMSKEDIKQEYKDSEGNPEIKYKRRETHREIQSGSLAANVAKSSVIVRNPTHIAICLYYQPGETKLPQVIEKGTGEVALHIIRLAENAGVPVVEQIQVARALMAETEVGDYIPSSLFEPVATILRMVMNIQYEQEPIDEDEESTHE